MSTISMSAIVMTGGKAASDALLTIHAGLLESEHFRPIHSLSVIETNEIIEDMAVGWIRFGHFWSDVNAYVANYATQVESLMYGIGVSSTGMPHEVYLDSVWDAWAKNLKAFRMGA